MFTTTTSIVQLLIETCQDSREIYAQAAAEVGRARLKECLSEMAWEHGRFEAELCGTLAMLGEDQESPTSAIAGLHRSWLDFHFAVSAGAEPAILADCERTAERAVGEYREALATADLQPQIRMVIERQLGELEGSAGQIRTFSLRAAA